MTLNFQHSRVAASIVLCPLLLLLTNQTTSGIPIGSAQFSLDSLSQSDRSKSAESLENSTLLEPLDGLNFPAGSLAQSLDAEDLELDPSILNSPVLQRWLDDPPDVLQDIRTDPAFRPRVRAGYTHIDDSPGYYIGIEDGLLGDVGTTGLALSADYSNKFEGDRPQWGADLRYYLLPLGNRVNLAPQVGYRSITTPDETVDGISLGGRLMLIPARTAAVDFSLTQTWINPGSESNTASLTTLSSGYALTQTLRLSSDIQLQLAPDRQDYRWGVGLEVLF